MLRIEGEENVQTYRYSRRWWCYCHKKAGNAKAVPGPYRYLVQVIMQRGIKSRKEIEATMKRILGNSTAKEGCNLVACEGHIQDLPADALSIRKAVL
jgi:hypothetical protein